MIALLLWITWEAWSVRWEPAVGYSLWNDEIGAGLGILKLQTWWQALIGMWRADVVPPLYNWLAWLSVRVYGPEDWAFRLPAILASVALIPVLGIWVSRLAGPTAGITAAMLAGFLANAFRYGYEARPYSLLVLLTALLWIGTHRLATRPTPRWIACLTLVVLALLLLTHYFALIVIACLAVGYLPALMRCLQALWMPRPSEGQPPPRKLVITGILVFLIGGFALWWQQRGMSMGEAQPWTDLHARGLWTYWLELFRGDRRAFYPVLGGWGGLWGAVPLTMTLIVGLGLTDRRIRGPLAVTSLLLIVMAVVAVPLLAYQRQNLLSSRFGLFILPAVILTASLGVDRILGWSRSLLPQTPWSTGRHWLSGIAALLLGFLTGSMGWVLARDFWEARKYPVVVANWRQTAAWIDGAAQRLQPLIVAVYSERDRHNLLFYLRGSQQPTILSQSAPTDKFPAQAWIINLGDSRNSSAEWTSTTRERASRTILGLNPPPVLYWPVGQSAEGEPALRLLLREANHMLIHAPEPYPWNGVEQLARYSQNLGWTESAQALRALEARFSPSFQRATGLTLLGQHRQAAEIMEQELVWTPPFYQRSWMWTNLAWSYQRIAQETSITETARTEAALAEHRAWMAALELTDPDSTSSLSRSLREFDERTSTVPGRPPVPILE